MTVDQNWVPFPVTVAKRGYRWEPDYNLHGTWGQAEHSREQGESITATIAAAVPCQVWGSASNLLPELPPRFPSNIGDCEADSSSIPSSKDSQNLLTAVSYFEAAGQLLRIYVHTHSFPSGSPNPEYATKGISSGQPDTKVKSSHWYLQLEIGEWREEQVPWPSSPIPPLGNFKKQNRD